MSDSSGNIARNQTESSIFGLYMGPKCHREQHANYPETLYRRNTDSRQFHALHARIDSHSVPNETRNVDLLIDLKA